MSQHEASKVTAIKDQAIGAIKETVGNMIGNEKLELKGHAQRVHGKNEYEYAKAQKAGEHEPQQFQQAYHDHSSDNQKLQEPLHEIPPSNLPQHQETFPPPHQVPAPVPTPPPQQTNYPNPAPPMPTGAPVNPQGAAPIPPPPLQNPSQAHALKDEAMGSIKESFGSAANNPQMEMAGKAQNIHGHNEEAFAKAQKEGLNEPQHFEHGTKTTDHAKGTVEGDKVSTLGALKDKTMGSIKQTLGSATGNQDMELKGKAQNIHGHHQEAFAKAQKEGLNEPAHFAQGTKNTDHAEGKVKGENPSSFSAMKDQAVGSIKESFGSATGNFQTEMAGKAQQMHGRNEAEFAKAQKEGLNEPVHYQHGTKTTDHAQGEVVGNDEPSKMTGYKDQTVGSMKETWGSMTGNQQMEMQGKAQKMQGSTECALAEEKKNPINA